MAEDDADRATEYEAEREAEIDDELERIDRDSDEVDGGDLGTQNAPREDADDLEDLEADDVDVEGEADAETEDEDDEDDEDANANATEEGR